MTKLFTKEEITVLILLSAELEDEEIAKILRIPITRVEAHKARIENKLKAPGLTIKGLLKLRSKYWRELRAGWGYERQVR